MRKTLLFVVWVLFTLYGASFISSCSEDEEELSAAAATGLQLNKTELELMEQSKDTLIATILPNDLKNLSVLWSSSADTIATVDDFGVVTGIKVGTAVITATTFGKPFSAECQITVTERPIPVEYLELDVESSILTSYDGEWETLQLNAIINPKDANVGVVWTSSDEKVATVTEDGFVQPVAQGVAIIRCVASNNESLRDSCQVRVVRENGVISAEILEVGSVLSLIEGEVRTLSAEMLPVNAEEKTVTWTSSDPSVLAVENTNQATAQITALKEGMAMVILRSNDGGFTDTCRVSVSSAAVTALSGLPETLIGIIGEQEEVSVTVQPSYAINKKVVWTSSDESVATVQAGSDSQQAIVNYLQAGTTVITATSEDNPGATISCTVTVKEKTPVNSLTGLQETITGTEGKTGSLSVTVNPSDASNKTVIWTSSDESIATVQAGSDSQQATVNYLKEGTAIITATSADNPEATMSCTVKVTPAGYVAVKSLWGNVSSGEITISMSGANPNRVFQVTVFPYDATNQEVTWKCTDESVVTVTPRTSSYMADIRPQKVGVATVTAISDDNPDITWTCVVTITE